jgi:hypothetical protein
LISTAVDPTLRKERVKDGAPEVAPDFLLRLVALTNFMRLSLLKAAHVDVGESCEAGNPGRSG